MSPDIQIRGDFDAEAFLADYWQQKPLMLRGAIDVSSIDISAEQLAGLACEEHINARLVLQDCGDYPWQVEHSPIDESRFAELPGADWSLLVSDVERHLPDTRRLLHAFRFIPDWRIDDLMISYAPPGGSVGAHTDAYDVFLIQLSGRRRWQIAERYDEDTLEGTDLRILKSFDAEQEWILEAGDLLYLPPNIAHHGIAVATEDEHGEPVHCLTASVGFRAPSVQTMMNSFIEHMSNRVTDEPRFRDRQAALPRHHAEIDQRTVDTFISYLKQNIAIDPTNVAHWLGEFCSDNDTFEDLTIAPDTCCDEASELRDIAVSKRLSLSPYSNCLFSRHDDSAMLYINGAGHDTSLAFAEQFCDSSLLQPSLFDIASDAEGNLLCQLFNEGILIDTDDH